MGSAAAARQRALELLLAELLAAVDDGRALAMAAAVCRGWRDAAAAEALWRRLCLAQCAGTVAGWEDVVVAHAARLGGFRRLYAGRAAGVAALARLQGVVVPAPLHILRPKALEGTAHEPNPRQTMIFQNANGREAGTVYMMPGGLLSFDSQAWPGRDTFRGGAASSSRSGQLASRWQ